MLRGIIASRLRLEEPPQGEEREPAERQVELLPHVVLRDPQIEAEPHVGEPDRLEELREEEHRPEAPRQRQMLMLKYGVFSTMMYLMLKRWRRSIFPTTAVMLRKRKPVSAKRDQPHRWMKSGNSAPFTQRQKP